MRRTAFEDLAAWKESPDRKPLVIRGARQVGKTWLMRQFGAQCYKNVVYFNFDEDVDLASVFEANKDPLRDRKSTRLNSSHWNKSRMPSSA